VVIFDDRKTTEEESRILPCFVDDYMNNFVAVVIDFDDGKVKKVDNLLDVAEED
jgi:hypothetical protein